ncbi:hypothetical protein BX600DRAFT_511077 [Xylariales sp. PMI_506]|nr:hypothetical protein BX600DRAFT_511077 [Xylariales sp. PMI_506]
MQGILGFFLGMTARSAAVDFTPLNITALASRDGVSVIQCWQLSSIPIEAMSAANYQIGNTTAATWSIIQPQTVVGEAWAPKVQLTVVLNGLIHVIAPAPPANGSSSTALAAGGLESVGTAGYFQPGTLTSSVLIAADLKETSHISGHWTEFPSQEATVLVQVPFTNNEIPDHTVLHDGACGVA